MHNIMNQNISAKGEGGSMLALVVSIGSIKMNHKHKPLKECNSKDSK